MQGYLPMSFASEILVDLSAERRERLLVIGRRCRAVSAPPSTAKITPSTPRRPPTSSTAVSTAISTATTTLAATSAPSTSPTALP